MPLEGSRVLVLRPMVNPDLVSALRIALDPQDCEPGTSSIYLEFESPETVGHARSHLGNPDAPVMIDVGSVAVVDGQSYEFWGQFAAVVTATEAHQDWTVATEGDSA